MADDTRIDIEIVDKVSPQVKTKIDGIAHAAREAHTALEQLISALGQINTSPMAKLLAAEAKLTTASAKLADANAKAALSQQRLATETRKTATAEARAATAQQKLASETQRSATATTRAELATTRLRKAQEQLTKSTEKGGFSFGVLAGKVAAVVAVLGTLWAAFKLADEFANLENRLRSTGLEGEGLNTVMGKLKDSANETRSSLSGTVELYSRLAVSSKELGVTQNELITFTKSLNQAIILSGANAAEAQAGLIQLSQGMASGTLRGDELRSVLEQLPAVADVIAKSLGVTRGQLRQLGAEGEISAQTILKAFKEAGPELGERFAKQAATGEQALTVLGNNIKTIFGNELKSTLQVVSGLILSLSKNINEILMVVKALAISLAGILAMSLARHLGQTQIAMQLMTVATANGATGMMAFRNVLQMTISTTGGLIAILGVAYYAYQKINEAADKRQVDEEQAAKRRATQAADDVVATLKLERAKLNEQNRLTEGWQDTRYKLEREKRVSQIDILNKEILRAEKQANAQRAVEAGTSTEEWLKQIEDAMNKAKTLTRPTADKVLKDATAQVLPTIADSGSVAKAQEANYAYSEITYQIDEMFRTLEMTDRQLAIHNALLEYSAKIPQDANAGAMLSVFEKQLNMYYDQKAISDELNAVYADTQGQLEGITAKQTALGMAFNQGLLGQAAYTSQMAALNAQAGELRMTMGDGTWADVFNNSLYSMVSTYQGVLPAMTSAFGDFFTSIEDGFANSVGRAIVYSEDLGAALENVAKSAIADFISALIKMGIQTAITSALQTGATTSALAAQTSASVAAASVTAGAWAPAATMTSLATLGANAAPASAGILSTSVLAESLAQVPGFQVGGYTGNAGVSDVAGVVHGREFVFDAQSVQRIGVGNLEAMRNGSAMASQGTGAGGNTYVYNYTDQVPNASQAERESNFTQFKRSMSSANADRTSKRAQVAL